MYSNVKFLLSIGKFSAETGKCLETGLKALNDYLAVLDYFSLDVSEEAFDKLRTKAKYYIGTIFFKVKDYE